MVRRDAKTVLECSLPLGQKMNIAEYFGSEEKPTASSLKWWIEHPAKPLPCAGIRKGSVAVGKRVYPEPPVEKALMWARKFTEEGKSPDRLIALVGKRINRSRKMVKRYLAEYLADLPAR